jgi:hypothetical protein
MNIHTSRQKEFGGPETMNWTPVELPVREPVALQSENTTAQSLMLQAYRVGKMGASGMMFLMLGATGLWTVVDLAKIVVSSFKVK